MSLSKSNWPTPKTCKTQKSKPRAGWRSDRARAASFLFTERARQRIVEDGSIRHADGDGGHRRQKEPTGATRGARAHPRTWRSAKTSLKVGAWGRSTGWGADLVDPAREHRTGRRGWRAPASESAHRRGAGHQGSPTYPGQCRDAVEGGRMGWNHLLCWGADFAVSNMKVEGDSAR